MGRKTNFNLKTFLSVTISVGVLMSTRVALAIELNWGGFGSMYYAQALSHDLQPGGFNDRHVDFEHFSLFGLNAHAKLTPEWGASLQVIATAANSGADPNNHFAEWAYVSYGPTSIVGLAIRLGRQRFPIWSAAENINTHFQLPYRAIPEIVYSISPFSSFDGVSVSRDWAVQLMHFNVAIFGGSPDIDGRVTPNVAYSGSDLIGAKIAADGDGWHARLQASLHSYDGGVNLGGQDLARYGGHVQNYSASYRFDKYNLLSWGEYVWVRSADGTEIPAIPAGTTGLPNGMPGGRFSRSLEAGYLLFGYHLGNFTPRYTFAASNAGAGYRSGSQQGHIVGLNYLMNSNVLLRAEYEYVKAHANQGDTGVQRPSFNSEASGSAVYAGVDFIF